ncbi:MAG: apolipoprotein N-acyltransferase [Gammaproteobacteria bacterium]
MSVGSSRGWRRAAPHPRGYYALALAAGLALPCAFAPYALWPLALLAPALLLWLLRGLAPRPAARLGYLFGLGYFGHGVWWIQVSVHQFGLPYYSFSVTATALLVAYMALFPALVAYALRRLPARDERARALLLAPPLWVASEWLRGWFLTGFPWLSLGYSQLDAPLAGVAPLLGETGTSFAVMVGAALLAAVPGRRGVGRLVPLVALVLLLFAGHGLGRFDATHETAGDLRATLVQGAIPQSLKWEAGQREHAFRLYGELTAPLWRADVVVWPETAIPAFAVEVPEMLDALTRAAREADTTLLLGVPTGEPWTGGRYYNSVLALGTEKGRYDKRHLVPFGEFFPLKSALAGISSLLSIPMSDFSAGAQDQPLLRAAGLPVGVSICYEDVYAREVTRALPAAAFLVNVSNDAWFGDTIAPHQHLQIARMRALETGRWLLRATNTGITAVIDHRGRVTARVPQFEPTALSVRFAARAGATPYVRFGDWPVLVVGTALLAAGVYGGRERRPFA